MFDKSLSGEVKQPPKDIKHEKVDTEIDNKLKEFSKQLSWPVSFLMLIPYALKSNVFWRNSNDIRIEKLHSSFYRHEF